MDMKKALYLLMSVAAISFAGCNQNNPDEPDKPDTPSSTKVTKTFSVTLPSVEGATVAWAAGDAIAVNDGKSTVKFSMVSGSNKGASADFAGSVEDGAESYIAVYPYSSNAYSAGKVNGTVPSNQKLEAGAVSTDAIYAVGAAAGDAVSLKSLVSFVKVTLGSGQTANAISVSSEDGSALAGDFTATVGAGAAVSSISGGEFVSASVLANGPFEGGRSYYLAVVGGVDHNSGITVSVDLGEGNIASKTTGKISTKAGEVTAVDMSDAEVKQIAVTWVNTPDVVSFDLGETKEFEVVGINVASIDFDPFGPAGWTTDASNAANGKVTITAPASLEGVESAANMTLIGTTATGSTTTASIVVRLYGVNNKEDLVAARDSVQRKGDVSAYLVDGAITLNADVSISTEDFLDNNSGVIFFPTLTYPFNGQGKTVTMNVEATLTTEKTGGQHYFSFIQMVKTDVKDLNLAGTMTLNDACKETRWGVLAGLVGAQSGDTECDINITNVHVSTDMVCNPTAAKINVRMAGLFGMNAGASIAEPKITVDKCSYSGNMTITQSIREIAGFIGLSGNGNPGPLMTIANSEFTGKIDYKQTVYNSVLRIAGFVGSAERTTLIDNCKSAGEITVDAGGQQLVSTSGGLAGFIGRTNAAVAPNNMDYAVTNSENTTKITVTNALRSDAGLNTSIGQLVGSIISTANLTLDGNKENGSISINYND